MLAHGHWARDYSERKTAIHFMATSRLTTMLCCFGYIPHWGYRLSLHLLQCNMRLNVLSRSETPIVVDCVIRLP